MGKVFSTGGEDPAAGDTAGQHALVDGLHIARFYEALDRELAAIAAEQA